MSKVMEYMGESKKDLHSLFVALVSTSHFSRSSLAHRKMTAQYKLSWYAVLAQANIQKELESEVEGLFPQLKSRVKEILEHNLKLQELVYDVLELLVVNIIKLDQEGVQAIFDKLLVRPLKTLQGGRNLLLEAINLRRVGADEESLERAQERIKHFPPSFATPISSRLFTLASACYYCQEREKEQLAILRVLNRTEEAQGQFLVSEYKSTLYTSLGEFALARVYEKDPMGLKSLQLLENMVRTEPNEWESLSLQEPFIIQDLVGIREGRYEDLSVRGLFLAMFYHLAKNQKQKLFSMLLVDQFPYKAYFSILANTSRFELMVSSLIKLAASLPALSSVAEQFTTREFFLDMLYELVRQGRDEIVFLLLKRIFVCGEEQKLAVFHAAIAGHRFMARRLLQGGTLSPVALGYLVFVLIADECKNHREIVEMLLEKGDLPDDFREVSIRYAVRNNDKDLVELLLSKGVISKNVLEEVLEKARQREEGREIVLILERKLEEVR